MTRLPAVPMLAGLLLRSIASSPGGEIPPAPMVTVEIEEDVYSHTTANNGAGPMWCSGSTCLVRVNERLFASGLETVPGVKPLNNCRWLLFVRETNGWRQVQADPDGLTREPSPIAGLPDGHPGPQVRQPEAGAPHHDRDQPRGVHRPEHDPAPPVLVHRVQPHIGLREGPEIRHPRHPQPAHPVHPEGDKTDVGDPVVGVRDGAPRQQRRHHGGVDRPVDEGEVQPLLGEERSTYTGGGIRRDGRGFRHDARMTEPAPRSAEPQVSGSGR